MSKELTVVHNEKDLFYYLQKIRLLESKRINDEKIENSKEVKEEKATFKGTMKIPPAKPNPKLATIIQNTECEFANPIKHKNRPNAPKGTIPISICFLQ